MNISILSVFPELYHSFLQTSLMNRAQKQGIVSFDSASFFEYVEPKQRIDAPPFGPGTGMLIKPEVVGRGIDTLEKKHGKAFKIFFSPQGKKLDQRLLRSLADTLSTQKHLMLVAGRYEGMDARVEEESADLVLSIGDYVLMGGDLPAMVFLEGFLRLLPDVVGKPESVADESFSGPFVDYPEYTEPVEWRGKRVPDIVRSGNHGAIAEWRTDQAAEKSVKQHFGWLRSYPMNTDEKQRAFAHVPSHYVALLHGEVMLPEERVGTTSVTSLDIHDPSRSAKTYGIENYFIVTPLTDQKKVVQTLLDFWQEGPGFEYNRQRFEAVKSTRLADDLDEVIAYIEKKEGVRPLVIATSAKKNEHAQTISYYDQSVVWQHNRPVLLIFGTGKGLSPQVIDRCDYLLLPVEGFTDFNHLSVRSAVAIVLDRWLGLNTKI